MTVMTAMLRRHGATIVQRNGRSVAAHFGSATSEAAVCRSSVGLAERSDRPTLEVRGTREDVDRALAELTAATASAWWARLAPGRVIIRCEAEDEDRCTAAMLRAQTASVLDVSAEYAALELLGPLAEEVLRAIDVDDDEDSVILVREGSSCVELLTARALGASLWNRVLEAGEPFGMACVGLDALDHLAVSEHVSGLRSHEQGVGSN